MMKSLEFTVTVASFYMPKILTPQKRDYDGLIAQFRNWMDRINKLLNNHQIKLLEDDGEYIVTMKDPAMYNTPNMCYRLTFSPDIQDSE